MTRRDATVGVTSGVDREYVLFRPISLSRRSERASGWRHRVAPASTPSEAKRAFPLTPLTGNVDLDYSGAGVSLATFTNSGSHGDPGPRFARTPVTGARLSSCLSPTGWKLDVLIGRCVGREIGRGPAHWSDTAMSMSSQLTVRTRATTRSWRERLRRARGRAVRRVRGRRHLGGPRARRERVATRRR